MKFRNWLERVDGRFMGTPVDVNPHDAILWAMRTAAGEVHYCDAQIRKLSADEIFERPEKVSTITSDQFDSVTETLNEEIVSRWVSLRKDAIERMAKSAKMALDVGIDERQVKLAEEQAQQLVSIISAVLVDLGHDLTDLRTREIVRLRLLEGANTIDSTATDITNGESE